MVDDEELCVIYVADNRVDEALKIIYETMELMGDPKEKIVDHDYWQYCSETFQDVLDENNIRAKVLEVG